ncbi:hypothetical protein EDD11_009006 [Mortierella claussenii]|nr:hypothetical protein EDD11_009006 [Mortierella claussenii]
MPSTQKLTLYSCRVCPYAARAVIAMAETQQEHDLIEIDISVPRPEWYLKDINPYGQVPALKIGAHDDSSVPIVLESLFVAEYILDIHPESGLLPEDALQRAQTRYLIHHWGAHTQSAIFKATIAQDPQEHAKLEDTVIQELEKVDTLLRQASRLSTDAEGPFFFGEKFTFADLANASFLVRLFLVNAFQENDKEAEAKFEQRLKESPKLKRFLEWRDAVVARPSVQKASPDKESMKNVFRKFLPKPSDK